MNFKEIVLRAPEKISKHFVEKNYKKGTTILFPGEKNTTLYLLTKGTIDIYKQAYNGTIIAIRSYDAYTYFGEMEIFNEAYRTVNVVAKTNCQVLLIEKEKVLEWIHLDPDLAIHFIEELTIRLANTSEIRLKLSLLTIKERILYTLYSHYQIGDLDQVTKKQLCAEVSAPVRSINRSLAECIAEGHLTYDNKHFKLTTPQKLKPLIETFY